MTCAVTLRPAAPGDAEAVHAMLKALAEDVGEAAAFVASPEDVRRDGLGTQPLYEVILAEAGGGAAAGAPVGLVSFFATYSTYRGAPCLCVNDLYVRPEARGSGAARRLMARVCRLARQRGCCRVELKVLHANQARSFYERIGMTATEEVAYTIGGAALTALAEED